MAYSMYPLFSYTDKFSRFFFLFLGGLGDTYRDASLACKGFCLGVVFLEEVIKWKADILNFN